MPTAKYFTPLELACHHCGRNGVTQELCDALDAFRTLAGKPVIIDDAYRCPVHNKQVGGVPDSQHVLGNAADIRVHGLSAAELFEIALQVPQIHGIGRADLQNYLHVDVRPAEARWCYNAQGRQIPWYESTTDRPIAA